MARTVETELTTAARHAYEALRGIVAIAQDTQLQAEERVARVLARAQGTLYMHPAHDIETRPVVRCSRCQRISYGSNVGETCGMVQPDSKRCAGTMVAGQ